MWTSKGNPLTAISTQLPCCCSFQISYLQGGLGLGVRRKRKVGGWRKIISDEGYLMLSHGNNISPCALYFSMHGLRFANAPNHKPKAQFAETQIPNLIVTETDANILHSFSLHSCSHKPNTLKQNSVKPTKSHLCLCWNQANLLIPHDCEAKP